MKPERYTSYMRDHFTILGVGKMQNKMQLLVGKSASIQTQLDKMKRETKIEFRRHTRYI